MNTLRQRHISLLNQVSLEFQRSLYHALPWDERLVAIRGARGIGKTYLLLQYIKQTYSNSSDVLYASLDDPYFYSHSLLEFADDFVNQGGKHLFLDEVHHYPKWALELKKIYDYHPDLKVVFTGSSLLEILNSQVDLSRRVLNFTMQGLSYREFLNYRYQQKFDVLSLEDIVLHHQEITLNINQHIKPLQYFQEYLELGYFPFHFKDKNLYFMQINELISMILEFELPRLRSVNLSMVPKLKQLLSIIANAVPFKPNVSSIAGKIGISRNTLLEYMNALDQANIIQALYKDSFGVSLLQKPEKIYLDNTNYMFALGQFLPNIGTLRETFFLNQLASNYAVNYSDKGDFLVDGKYIFEVGGKNKTESQIKGLPNAFLAIDEVEYGYTNRIPLWLFGFLY